MKKNQIFISLKKKNTLKLRATLTQENSPKPIIPFELESYSYFSNFSLIKSILINLHKI